MSQKYARLLNDQDLVEHFLSNVLDFDFSKLNDITYDIIACEKGLVDLGPQFHTLYTTKFRDRNYKEENKRWELRNQIIEELLQQQRPVNDDKIKLGKKGGGALPRTELQLNKQAYIVIGLPASGKSAISNKISDEFGGIILDSDLAKRKLPEFSRYPWGATVVHEESSQIVFGFKDNPQNLTTVWEEALAQGYNMVIPKIGQSPESIIALAKVLRSFDYEVHLTLVSLKKREATIRAINRFYQTNRYVPLGLIFDGYGNDPCLSYHVIKNKVSDVFSSFGAISTNTPKGQLPVSIDHMDGNPSILYSFQENILI